MKVLILGSGGREHSLVWKIAQSETVEQVYIAPGNAGTGLIGINLDLQVNDFEGIKKTIVEKGIGLLIVGPEDPLVNGLRDFLEADDQMANINIIGPSKEGAMLEGSKDFAKKFMVKYNIPTARYMTFTRGQSEEAFTFLESLSPPYVLKADGLAAGKGVLILEDIEIAKNELVAMLDGKFGSASEHVVIEEFLDGIEMSAFALTDGENYVMLPDAKDYKRIGEGDTGLNTGGMGAISPVPFAKGAFMQKVEDKVIKPTIEGIHKEGYNYKGFVFFGLINVGGEPFVIEYNIRLGDPETEVVVPRIKSDLVPALVACAQGKLSEITVETDPRAATTVMLVSGGYPEAYEKGKIIEGLEDHSDSIIFHAGTKASNGEVLTNGGRVLSITSYADNFREALKKSYKLADQIKFEKKYFRRDIGFDLN